MKIELLYFDGCPNWRVTRERLTEALAQLSRDDAPELVEVLTDEQAAALSFAGSPTVLIDGADPFPHTGGPHGLACRVYPTPAGLAGSPTTDQLAAAITAASDEDARR